MSGPDRPLYALYGEWCAVHREEWQDHDCDQYDDPDDFVEVRPTLRVTGLLGGQEVELHLPAAVARLFEAVHHEWAWQFGAAPGWSMSLPPTPAPLCPTRPTYPRPIGERVPVPGRLL